MNQYLGNMRQDHPPPSDMAHIYTSYHHPMRNISPQEIEGLVVVLKLIQKVTQMVCYAIVPKKISLCNYFLWRFEIYYGIESLSFEIRYFFFIIINLN